MKYMENKLTKGSAKDLWFRICMLHLANDVRSSSEVNIVERKVQNYFVKVLIEIILLSLIKNYK